MENVENFKKVAFLDTAVTKSQNIMLKEHDKKQVPDVRFIQLIKLKNSESNVKKIRTYKGNISGLNLCSVKSEDISNKPKVDEAKDNKIANGRHWKHAEIYNSPKLSRRPLHPEAHSNEKKNADGEKETYQNGKKEVFFVCSHCGGLSKDRIFCDWCGKPLPKDKKPYVKESENVTQPTKNPETLIKKQAFYSKKFQEYKYPSLQPVAVEVQNPVSRTRQTAASRFCRKLEPECLTISSDESDNDNNLVTSSGDKNNSSALINMGQQNGPIREDCKESSSVIDSTERKDTEETSSCENSNVGDSNSENYVPSRKHRKISTSNADVSEVSLKCRSIRIGSHKVIPHEPFKLSTNGISFTSHTVRDERDIVTIHMEKKDIIRILGCFNKSLPIFYIFTTPGFAGSMRSLLRMSKSSKTSAPYYDPASLDETEKRITVIPDDVNSNELTAIKNILNNFEQEGHHEKVFNEIDSKQANEILIRSTPEMPQSTVSVIQKPIRANIINLMTYPPPPQRGGITITTDDYDCLEEGQFVNDVIIDFYLKYLVQNKLSDEDQKRTHVFSSFFYRRLTQKPLRKHSMNEDPNLSPAENRHSRVKTWTRHVDIFEKDFIIIPINENSHWFLAVVCFPYLDGPINFSADTNEIKAKLPLLNETDTNMSNTSTNTILNESFCDIKPDEPMDTNDVENEDMQINYTIEEEETRESQENMQGCIKQPCILIFDSLLGPSKARIIAILREYLKVEWQVKKKTIKTFDKDILKGTAPKVPQQKNYSDCGIYLLQYVESFFQTPIQDYTVPIRSLQEWFTDDEVSKKREQLKGLIYKLMLEQQGRSVLPNDKPIPSSQSQESETSESQASTDNNNTLWNIDSQS